MLTKEIRKLHDQCVKVNELENRIRKSRGNERRIKIEEKRRRVRDLHPLMDHITKAFMNQLGTHGFSNFSNADFVSIAEVMGRYLSYNIRMNAIRRFLTAFRKIEVAKPYDPDLVALVRPKLAYAVGRSSLDEKRFLLRFMGIFDPVLQAVSATGEEKDFEKSLKFMESVIAYHRFYGGDDS
ncbi:type III-A CRISPR-associated protein Csm2 [Desulfococcaceae bacterium HSG8]|nr:type III-A CRISPR-associated protein Csm2 [Desulfococcaceae bacterium HSG8]